MFDETKERPLASHLLENPSRDREPQAEPEEILRQNWREFGRMSHDVGFERALADWIIKHRSDWRKNRQPETQLNRLSAS